MTALTYAQVLMGVHPGSQSSDGAMMSDFALLRREVLAAGLLKQRPFFVVLNALAILAMLALSVGILLITDNLIIQLLNAVFLAFVWGQIGLLGHDAGHCQIFRKQRWNMALSQACSLLVGVSSQYWVEKHNEHHANPNHEDMDPDIDYYIIAFSRKQVEEKTGVARWIIAHQSLLFFPIISLVFVSLRMGSITYFRSKSLKTTWPDVLSFCLHFLMYGGLIFGSLPFFTAIAFVLTHQVFWGLYLGSIFAPNHKGMPMITDATRMDFLREQVLTARNVTAHPVTDILYGGLNYQIEHHLFPHLPRCNLRSTQRIVRQFCKERGISYHETGILQSYREVLTLFREMALYARELREEERALLRGTSLDALRAHVRESLDNAETELQSLFQTTIEGVDHAELQQKFDRYNESLLNIRVAVAQPLALQRQQLEQYKERISELLSEARSRVPGMQTV